MSLTLYFRLTQQVTLLAGMHAPLCAWPVEQTFMKGFVTHGCRDSPGRRAVRRAIGAQPQHQRERRRHAGPAGAAPAPPRPQAQGVGRRRCV